VTVSCVLAFRAAVGLAAEIMDDLEAALEQFSSIYEELGGE